MSDDPTAPQATILDVKQDTTPVAPAAIDDDIAELYWGGGRGSFARYPRRVVKEAVPAPVPVKTGKSEGGLLAGLKKSVATLFGGSNRSSNNNNTTTTTLTIPVS